MIADESIPNQGRSSMYGFEKFLMEAKILFTYPVEYQLSLGHQILQITKIRTSILEE